VIIRRLPKKVRSCLNFPTEAIFVSDRAIFSPAEGDVGVPTASEAGEKSADRRRKVREWEISNNF
jgi:hypothetical protein